MLYADMVGLDKVYESICRYHELYGDIWEPAPLIKRLSEQGKTFYDFLQIIVLFFCRHFEYQTNCIIN